jgi:hypothetical protein
VTEFLQSIKSDLLSRRIMPIAALALLALAVAVGYALAGSSSSAPPVARTGGSPQPAALAVAAASPNPNTAESETPGGLRYQSGGPTRDPFAPLAQPKGQAKPATAAASQGSSSAGSAGQPGGAGPGAGKAGGVGPGGSEPAPAPPKPNKPSHRKKFPYDVSILFGRLPATPGQEVTLPPYQNLQPQRPLPSAGESRIALERVSGDAKRAVFALLAPAIPHGQGVCLPSPTECQQIALESGKLEELEYIEGDGQVVVYELKTVSIVRSSSQAAG